MNLLLKALSAVVALLVSVAAWAGESAYNPPAFQKALSAGQPVIVFFHADWCPTCKAQAPVARALIEEPKMKEVTLFLADFDREKDLKKSLRVTSQSTFVVFKGGKEVARSTGQTDKAALAAVFAKAL